MLIHQWYQQNKGKERQTSYSLVMVVRAASVDSVFGERTVPVGFRKESFSHSQGDLRGKLTVGK